MQDLKGAGILTNFIGAMIDSLAKQGHTPAEINHLVVASLAETIADLAKKPDGTMDLYVMKPVFRLLVTLYTDENRKLAEDGYLVPVQQKMQQNDRIIRFFEEELRNVTNNLEEMK